MRKLSSTSVYALNYYPFGMVEPGRSYTVQGFDYGFNNKLNDNDVEGIGNFQDYGFRMYSPRLGRFISIDPLSKKFPELSTYQFASNRVVDGIDLNGKEFEKTNQGMFIAEVTFSGEITPSLNPNKLPNDFKTKKIESIADLEQEIGGEYRESMNEQEDGESPMNAATAVANGAEKFIEILGGHGNENAYETVARQIFEFSSSVNMVDAADRDGLFPRQFENDVSFKKDLVNYIFDASKPFGVGEKGEAYQNIISFLGAEIYNNSTEILTHKYSRPGQSYITTNSWHLDQPSPLRTKYIPIYGQTEFNRLLDKYNKASTGSKNGSSVENGE